MDAGDEKKALRARLGGDLLVRALVEPRRSIATPMPAIEAISSKQRYRHEMHGKFDYRNPGSANYTILSGHYFFSGMKRFAVQPLFLPGMTLQRDRMAGRLQ
jgi:hypothetical protein